MKNNAKMLKLFYLMATQAPVIMDFKLSKELHEKGKTWTILHISSDETICIISDTDNIFDGININRINI